MLLSSFLEVGRGGATKDEVGSRAGGEKLVVRIGFESTRSILHEASCALT